MHQQKKKSVGGREGERREILENLGEEYTDYYTLIIFDNCQRKNWYKKNIIIGYNKEQDFSYREYFRVQPLW